MVSEIIQEFLIRFFEIFIRILSRKYFQSYLSLLRVPSFISAVFYSRIFSDYFLKSLLSFFFGKDAIKYLSYEFFINFAIPRNFTYDTVKTLPSIVTSNILQGLLQNISSIIPPEISQKTSAGILQLFGNSSKENKFFFRFSSETLSFLSEFLQEFLYEFFQGFLQYSFRKFYLGFSQFFFQESAGNFLKHFSKHSFRKFSMDSSDVPSKNFWKIYQGLLQKFFRRFSRTSTNDSVCFFFFKIFL